MRRRWLPIALLAAATLADPGRAVGLGPLAKSGLTDGPAKGFYLTLINPYPGREAFTIYAIGADDEIPQPRVQVPASALTLAGRTNRKFMIVATGLTPGESFSFRVCAEKANDNDSYVHARVCSRLTARRVAAGA